MDCHYQLFHEVFMLCEVMTVSIYFYFFFESYVYKIVVKMSQYYGFYLKLKGSWPLSIIFKFATALIVGSFHFPLYSVPT
jgi:hypothetical protein